MEQPKETEYGLRYERKLDTCTACFHTPPNAEGKWELSEAILEELVNTMVRADLKQA